MRRVICVPFSPALIAGSIETGHEIHCRVASGLPSGAVYIGSTFDERRLCVYLLFSHASFEPVKDTDLVPELNIKFEKLSFQAIHK